MNQHFDQSPAATPSPEFFRYTARLWLSFIVYGSLIPFQSRGIALADGLEIFSRIPWLDLGIGSRADWVANGVLYVPLTFLWLAHRAVQAPGTPLFGTAVRSLLGAVVVAVTVEYLQVYVSPRTVSLNDLFAEILGAMLGVAVWFLYSRRLLVMLAALFNPGRSSLNSILILYFLAIGLFSVFPFDFVVSYEELRDRISQPGLISLFSNIEGSFFRILAEVITRILVFVPVGILMALGPHRPGGAGVPRAAAVTMAFVLIIQVVNIFEHSGTPSYAVVFLAGLGAVAGHSVARPIEKFVLAGNWTLLRYGAWIAAPFYLAVLTVLRGWWGHSLPDIEVIRGVLSNINWAPFYYHYFTTEVNALASTARVAISFAPLGTIFWIFTTNRSTHKISGLWITAISALVIAVIFESGRLVFSGLRPDPTNIFIAPAMSVFVHWACFWFVSAVRGREEATEFTPLSDSRHDAAERHPRQVRHPKTTTIEVSKPDTVSRIFAVVLLAGILTIAWYYPLAPWALVGGLFLYGVVLWRWPNAWLIVLPALLPVLDLAPWSGWFVFDEFDLIVLLTVAVGAWRTGLSFTKLGLAVAPRILLVAMTASFVISAVIGLLPLNAPDWNALGTYDSNYNSLRVAKGFIWAVLLLPSFAVARSQGNNVLQYFSIGMALGLSGVVAAGIAERIIFTGLFNMTNDYRITTLFSSMHIGGQHIDGYLSLAFPFIAIFLSMRPRLFFKVFAACFLVAACYIVLVTFTRWTYVSVPLSVLIFGLGIVISRRVKILSWRPLVTIILVGAAGLLLVQAVQFPYAKSRFATATADLDLRMKHWRDALAMRDPDRRTSLLGMGLGSFPHLFAAKNSKPEVPAKFRYVVENENRFLRFTSGNALYFGQRIWPESGPGYRIQFRARTTLPETRVKFPICEKGLINAFACSGNTVTIKGGGVWNSYETTADLSNVGRVLGRIPGLNRRPVEVAIYYNDSRAPLDIDDIRLIGPDGRNYVENGTFNESFGRWFFAVDRYYQWHEESLWVHLWLEQGSFGVVTFSMLALSALVDLARRIRRGEWRAAMPLGGLVGFLCAGIFGTLLDAPRLVLLCFMLIIIGILGPPPSQHDNLNKIHAS